MFAVPVHYHFSITVLEECSDVMLQSETVSLSFSEQFVSLRSKSNFFATDMGCACVNILCCMCLNHSSPGNRVHFAVFCLRLKTVAIMNMKLD